VRGTTHLVYLVVIAILALWLSFYIAASSRPPIGERVLFPNHFKMRDARFVLNGL
jgi:hypothetical protein